jgi:hypothetical protein
MDARGFLGEVKNLLSDFEKKCKSDFDVDVSKITKEVSDRLSKLKLIVVRVKSDTDVVRYWSKNDKKRQKRAFHNYLFKWLREEYIPLLNDIKSKMPNFHIHQYLDPIMGIEWEDVVLSSNEFKFDEYYSLGEIDYEEGVFTSGELHALYEKTLEKTLDGATVWLIGQDGGEFGDMKIEDLPNDLYKLSKKVITNAWKLKNTMMWELIG